MIDRSHLEGGGGNGEDDLAIPKERQCRNVRIESPHVAPRGAAACPLNGECAKKYRVNGGLDAAPYRGNLDAVIGDVNAVEFREQIPPKIPRPIFTNSARANAVVRGFH